MSLRTKIICIFVILFFLIFGLLSATYYVGSAQKQNNAVINIAGRQRMLLEQITLQTLKYYFISKDNNSDADIIINELNVSRKGFEEGLHALKYSGKINLSMYSKNPEYVSIPSVAGDAYKQLLAVEGIWNVYVAKIKDVVDDKDKTASLRAILDLNPVLLDEADKSVLLMQKQFDQDQQRLLRLQLIGLASVSLFIVVSLVIFFYILINPIEEIIEKVNSSHNPCCKPDRSAKRKPFMQPREIFLLNETFDKLTKNNEELLVKSNIDELTGVLNRRGFYNSILPMLHLAKREKACVAVMIIDIDHFKKVNDTFGHLVGDRVLKLVASIISQNIRGADVFGRYGGEEFLVFMSQIHECNLLYTSEKIRQLVEKETSVDIPVTVSIGVSAGLLKYDVDKEFEALVKQADTCLYKAKGNGRNQVVITEKSSICQITMAD